MHVTAEPVIRVLEDDFLEKLMEVQEKLIKTNSKRTRKRTLFLYSCDYICTYCNHHGTTIDHIKPKAKGGSERRRNLACACLLCNGMKGDMSETEFRKMIELKDYDFLSNAQLNSIIKQVHHEHRIVPNDKHWAMANRAKKELEKRATR